MIRKHWVLALLPLAGSASAFAQVTGDSTGKQLNEVVVTATRYPVKQSQTGKVVIVIPHEQIEKSIGKPLGELLGEQAGITVTGSLNDPGSPQTVSIRGAGSGRTLVLIDGIPVGDPSELDNSFDINLIPVTMIERIEISKGAQSTLYGSDAIAGVINIITVKAGPVKPFEGKASLSAGNYGTYNGNAQVYGKLAKRLSYQLRYNGDHSAGFPTARDTTNGHSPVPFLNNGYHGNAVAGNLAWNPVAALTVTGFLQYSGYTTSIDAGAFAPAVDYTSGNKDLMAGGGIVLKLASTTITGHYLYNSTNRQLLEDSVFGQTYYTDRYRGVSRFVEVFANTDLGAGFTLLNGADYRLSSMNEDGNAGGYPLTFRDTSLSQASMYSSLLYSGHTGLSVELGGRLSTDSRYGSSYTYTFNPAWLVSPDWKFYGSIASAFKAPTLYQLYSPYGDPGLQPERSTSYEGGVQFDDKRLNTRATFFHRETKDGIDYNFFTNRYYNFDAEKGIGIEWEGSVRLSAVWSIAVNYTWLKMRERTQSHVSYEDTTYSYALRIPQHTVNLTLGARPVAGLFLSLSGHYESKRHDIGGYDANFNPLPDVALDPFLIVNGYAEYRVIPCLKLFAEGRNLLNRKFYTIYGYNAIPAMFTAGATFAW